VPKILIEFTSEEAFALLAAQEFLRQSCAGPDEFYGTPPIRAILPSQANREYTELYVNFVYTPRIQMGLRVRVNAGDTWPKEGTVLVGRADMCEEDGRSFRFRLFGNPGEPRVEFPESPVMVIF